MKYSCFLLNDKNKEIILIICDQNIYLIESYEIKTKKSYNLIEFGRIPISSIQDIRISKNQKNSLLLFSPYMEFEEEYKLIYPRNNTISIEFQKSFDFENFLTIMLQEYSIVTVVSDLMINFLNLM